MTTGYLRVFTFKLTKMKGNEISVTVVTFQVLRSHMWLMAATLDSAAIEYFHHNYATPNDDIF